MAIKKRTARQLNDGSGFNKIENIQDININEKIEHLFNMGFKSYILCFGMIHLLAVRII